jgi:hypothetical protein
VGAEVCQVSVDSQVSVDRQVSVDHQVSVDRQVGIGWVSASGFFINIKTLY